MCVNFVRYFAKAKVVLTSEETGMREKLTAETNKHGAEVLEWQQLGQSACKLRATVLLKEAQWNSFSKEAL